MFDFQSFASDGSRRGVVGSYVLFLVASFLLCCDYGVLPASLLMVKEDYGLDDFEAGLLGTLVYAGLSLSSLVSGWLLHTRSPRGVMLTSFALSAVGDLMSAFAPNKWCLFAARLWVGLAHGPAYVFIPWWIDGFAPDGQETRWMGLQQVLGPIANLVAYGCTAGIIYGLGWSWRWVFAALSVMVLALVPACGAVPRRLWAPPKDGAHELGCRDLRSYPSFWLLSLVPCLAYFAVCGAEYWANVMLIHLGAAKTEAPLMFLAVGVFGPTLGTAAGGPLVDAFGGYRQRARALRVCVCCVSVAVFSAPWVMWPATVMQMLVATGVCFFSFAMVLPALTGLALDSVPLTLRPLASGALAFLTDALGFQFAPVVAGAVAQEWGIAAGWRSCFTPGIILSIPLIGLAACCDSGVSQSPGRDRRAARCDESTPLVAGDQPEGGSSAA